jgi:hypothetical protein
MKKLLKKVSCRAGGARVPARHAKMPRLETWDYLLYGRPPTSFMAALLKETLRSISTLQ